MQMPLRKNEQKSKLRYPVLTQPKEVHEASDLLNVVLANELGLFVKTLNYHWNITGPRFYMLHKLLDENYHEILEIVDSLAERVRIIGGRPVATLKDSIQEMEIQEAPGKFPGADEILSDLHRDNLIVIDSIQSALDAATLWEKDLVTQDFLIQIKAKHEKMDWMIRSHLI